MAESYFFALVPKFLKTQHSFAKNIKPNTKYRLMVFKGIQKCDEMEEGTRSKIVGGKIELQSKELLFNIPYFSPIKNIAFNIKLYEQKPNEEETQIVSYSLGSSDYIKQYKADKTTNFQVNAQFQSDLQLQFELYLEKSKDLLVEVMKKISPSRLRSPRSFQEDNVSQQSKQLVREGEGFISPKRRIERKRGHEGRLRSRSRSHQKGDNLVTSPRSIRSGANYGVSSDKVADNKSSVGSQNPYQYQPTSRLKYTNTKDIFDIKIQRSNSPQKSPKDVQQTVKSPQSKISFTYQPQQTSVQSVTQSASTIISKTNVSSPVQPKPNTLTSPKSQSGKVETLEIKQTSKVFDIVPIQKLTSPKSEQYKNSGIYEPKRQPKVFESQSSQSVIKNSVKSGKGSSSQLGSNSQIPSFENMKESKIVIKIEGQVDEPRAVIIGSEEQERDSIKLKIKPVRTKKDPVHQSGTLKGSSRLRESIHNIKHEAEIKEAEKSYDERKNSVLYAIFLIVSIFLIYHAMSPTRRV